MNSVAELGTAMEARVRMYSLNARRYIQRIPTRHHVRYHYRLIRSSLEAHRCMASSRFGIYPEKLSSARQKSVVCLLWFRLLRLLCSPN